MSVCQGNAGIQHVPKSTVLGTKQKSLLQILLFKAITALQCALLQPDSELNDNPLDQRIHSIGRRNVQHLERICHLLCHNLAFHHSSDALVSVKALVNTSLVGVDERMEDPHCHGYVFHQFLRLGRVLPFFIPSSMGGQKKSEIVGAALHRAAQVVHLPPEIVGLIEEERQDEGGEGQDVLPDQAKGSEGVVHRISVSVRIVEAWDDDANNSCE
mmetsp:Transcript_25856/g.48183  ORF Transcript_25856/g.48183 Transcript_25856/m.48183 type:complete len:214 (+) Transcript_25856:288-929(+)